MHCGHTQVLLVALSLSMVAVHLDAAPHMDLLADLLQSNNAEDKEDVSHTLLLKILSALMRKEDHEVLSGMKELGVREEVVRQLPLSQRERKAGCRNFFWKTFTSC